jgi:putative effector of murein hydrolase LrgA (UPF0299 family)
VDEETKSWVRNLPLLFVGGVLGVAGAWVFFDKGDSVASIASMTLGVVLVTAWLVMEIIRIHEDRKQGRRSDGGGPDAD